MASRYLTTALAAALALGAWPALASAHGLAGKRFFPSTLTIDDPFVADELSLPTFLHIKEPDGQVTSISGEFSKRIFPDLGLTLEGEWNLLERVDRGPAQVDAASRTLLRVPLKPLAPATRPAA